MCERRWEWHWEMPRPAHFLPGRGKARLPFSQRSYGTCPLWVRHQFIDGAAQRECACAAWPPSPSSSPSGSSRVPPSVVHFGSSVARARAPPRSNFVPRTSFHSLFRDGCFVCHGRAGIGTCLASVDSTAAVSGVREDVAKFLLGQFFARAEWVGPVLASRARIQVSHSTSVWQC